MAPYLAYLRQDARAEPGEALTSHYFARLLSSAFDWLVTVDPHLHRIPDLDEVYTARTRVVEAADAIAQWIDANVESPLLVGPDEESRQWVSAVADRQDFPTVILEKERHGAYDVEIQQVEAPVDTERRPVLIDDIISTGRTMIEASRHLESWGMGPPICIGIHGLFADDALSALRDAGVADIVTCNTVDHETNAIDVTDGLADGIGDILDSGESIAVVSGVEN